MTSDNLADGPSAFSAEESQEAQRRSITKSDIAFPYINLEDSAAIPQVMAMAGGLPMSRDQIAQALGVSPDNSTLSVRLSAARLFGLIAAAGDGQHIVTDLGNKINAPSDSESRAARKEAFLNVELYAKLFDHFRNKPLPQRPGIEAVIVSLGVSEKQKDKARQAFEKSAIYAGIMPPTKDRLVLPIIHGPPYPVTSYATQEKAAGTESPQAHIKPIQDPSEHRLIRGMLDLMPPIGSDWPMAARAKWLRVLVGNMAMIYEAEDAGDIDVKHITPISAAPTYLPPPPPNPPPPPPAPKAPWMTTST